MADYLLTGVTNKAIETALNGLSARQQVIANNVANVDTPGYRASDVTFEAELRGAMRGRQGRFFTLAGGPRPKGASVEEVSRVRPAVAFSQATSQRNDGNTVDIDREMVELAETSIRYSALSRVLSERFSILRAAASEGRR